MCSVSVMSDSLWPHGLQPARLFCPWGFSRQEYWSGLPRHPPGDLSNPGMEPMSPTLQADSLPSEPPGKPKNARRGSLSLLQGIFLTRGSNWDLLHCRWILHHWATWEAPVNLSHWGKGRREAAFDTQELVRTSQLGLVVLLLALNNVTEQQKRPL